MALQPRQPQYTPNRFFNPDEDFNPNPPQPAPQRGDIATASPSPSGPPASAPAPADQFFQPQAAKTPTFEDYTAQHGNAPVAGAPVVPHHGKIASIMLGIGEALGNPLATRLGQRDRQLQQDYNDYERELPATQYKANRSAYEQEIGNEQKSAEIAQSGATTAETQQRTKNLQLVGPPGKQEFLKDFTKALHAGEDDPQELFSEYAARSGPYGVTRKELADLIDSTPLAAPQAKIGPQGIAEPIRYRGKVWNGTEPDAPEEVKRAFATEKPVETTIHHNVLEAADRARSNIVLKNDLGNGPFGSYNVPAGATGEAALANLDPATAATVRMLAEGKTDFQTFASRMSTTAKNNLAGLVHAFNPEFDQATFQVRKRVQEDLTSGGKSNTILAYNTALNHMQTFLKLADKLQNGDVQALNQLGQAINTEFGGDAATNFALARDFFSGEVGKAAAGVNATQGERKELGDKISQANSWTQLKGAAATAAEFLEGKRSAMQHQAEAGLQGKADFGAPANGGDKGIPVGATATHQDGSKWKFNGGDPADMKNWSKIG